MLQQDLEAASQFQPVDRAAWRALVDQDLKGAPFERKLVSHTYEGLYLQPLYTADDWPSAGDPSGFSGVRPLTRGAVPLGNAPHGWAICQERFEADPAAARAAILEDLAGGVDAAQFTATDVFERASAEEPLLWTGQVPIRLQAALRRAGVDLAELLRDGGSR